MNVAITFLHPFTSFFYFVLALLMIFLYQHPFFLLMGCLLLIAIQFLLDKGQTLKRWFLPITFLFFFLLIMNPLFNHRGSHILFYFFDQPITKEAITQGLMNALTVIAILFIAFIFNIVITSDKFLFLFSKWTPKWALVGMLALRFVPLFRRRLKEINDVQKTRGKSVSSSSRTERIKSSLEMVQILLTWSLEEGIETADSMTARGYGLKKRTKYQPYKLGREDFFILFFLTLLTLFGLMGWYLGDGVLSLWPVFEPVWLYGREWFYFFIFTLILGFPLWIEAKESIIWHYWKQKN